MKEETQEDGTESVCFWKTLPGFLTFTAILFTTLAVLLAIFLPKDIDKYTAAANTTTAKPSGTCWSADPEFPQVVPMSLKSSMPYKDYLYWFKGNIDNGCSYPLHLEVSFAFKHKPDEHVIDFNPDLNTLDFDVPPHRQFVREMDPVFTFLKKDMEADLPVNWKLEDDKNNLLAKGSDTIHILPKDRIKWDLAMPDRKVPQNFLLASLAAWTLQPAPEVKDIARKMFQSIDEKVRNGELSAFASTWMDQCYLRMFKDVRQVIPDVDVWSSFPPNTEEVVRMPSEVISGGHFDPVETAILWSALTNAVGMQERMKCALVSGKLAKEADKRRAFLLAWRANTSDAKWSAIDLRRGPELSFEANRKGAANLLVRFFDNNPQLEKSLLHKGVFLGGQENIVAIDFDRSATIYHIEELP